MIIIIRTTFNSQHIGIKAQNNLCSKLSRNQINKPHIARKKT